jgi:CRISPR-associated protein Cst2
MTDKPKNIFATVLTYPSPSANYRGESENNRTVLQKITKRTDNDQEGANTLEYVVISPDSIRNAAREILAIKVGDASINRRRLRNEEQLAVEFKEFPNASKFADDFLFGFMVADKAAVSANKALPSKRDSVLRINFAVALEPYRFDATFHQSPMNMPGGPFQNSSSSALLHREVSHTAFQYPFALAGADCALGKGKLWASKLLETIGELTNVAGSHARSFYEMAPRSVVVRTTHSLVAGFDTYGFDSNGSFKEIERLLSDNDLPAAEFWFGGEIVRKLSAEHKAKLEAKGTKLYENAQKLLADLATEVYGKLS